VTGNNVADHLQASHHFPSSSQANQNSTTQPTPPPSPARNRASTNETDSRKSSLVNKETIQSSQASPHTSPKQSHTACSGSPSRNFCYYTASSAELTPPGSPSKSRNNGQKNTTSNCATTISNKNNTIVWHQATPPSSPKRTIRRAKTSSPKLKISGKGDNLAQDFRDSTSTQSIPNFEERIHRIPKISKKGTNLNMESKSDLKPRSKRENKNLNRGVKSDVVVKITSPTSPPDESNENTSNYKIRSHAHSLNETMQLKSHHFNENHHRSDIDVTKPQRLIDRHRQRCIGLHRQSSLPDDYCEYSSSPKNVPIHTGRPKQRKSKPILQRSVTLEEEVSNDVTPNDSNFIDTSFNSATLSYGTLFYSPKSHSRTLFNSMKSISSGSSTDSVSVSSHHIIKIPPNRYSSSQSVRHSDAKENARATSGKPSNALLLRERFASTTSRSLDSETNGGKSRCETTGFNSRKVSNDNHIYNVNRASLLNTAPSLPVLREHKRKESTGSTKSHRTRKENLSEVSDSPTTTNQIYRSHHGINSPGIIRRTYKKREKVISNGGHDTNGSINGNTDGAKPANVKRQSHPPQFSTIVHSNQNQHTKYCSVIQNVNSSPSPTRLCRITSNIMASKSNSSNVPSWMKQTFSRLLASTSPPHTRKQTNKSDQSQTQQMM